MSTADTVVNPKIFSAYDVRGVYGQDLTDEVAYRIGRAAAQYLDVPENRGWGAICAFHHLR